MCMALYMCSGRKPEEKKRNDKYENIAISCLNGEDFSEILEVEKHFKYRYVYEFSYGGCACDFSFLINEDMDDESRVIQENRKKILLTFFDYLNEYIKDNGEVEIYSCWMGEEIKPRNTSLDMEINLKNFKMGDSFSFKDKQYVLITNS